MKKYIIIILVYILFNNGIIYGQSKIAFNYEDTYLGSQLSLNYGYTKKKNEFTARLNYFINTRVVDFQSHIYYNRFFASTFKERWGLGLGYGRIIKLKKSNIELAPFYKVDFANMKNRNRLFAFKGKLANGSDVFHSIPFETPNTLFTINSLIGIEFRAKLYKNIYLTAAAGTGMLFIFNDPEISGIWLSDGFEKVDFAIFSNFLSFGVEYRW
mgnify:FL=1